MEDTTAWQQRTEPAKVLHPQSASGCLPPGFNRERRCRNSALRSFWNLLVNQTQLSFGLNFFKLHLLRHIQII